MRQLGTDSAPAWRDGAPAGKKTIEGLGVQCRLAARRPGVAGTRAAPTGAARPVARVRVEHDPPRARLGDHEGSGADPRLPAPVPRQDDREDGMGQHGEQRRVGQQRG